MVVVVVVVEVEVEVEMVVLKVFLLFHRLLLRIVPPLHRGYDRGIGDLSVSA